MKYVGWTIYGLLLTAGVMWGFHEQDCHHQAKAQLEATRDNCERLSTELAEAKELVQKNEIGELKRRWRLFGR